jgi:hypothetical protein
MSIIVPIVLNHKVVELSRVDKPYPVYGCGGMRLISVLPSKVACIFSGEVELIRGYITGIKTTFRSFPSYGTVRYVVQRHPESGRHLEPIIISLS